MSDQFSIADLELLNEIHTESGTSFILPQCMTESEAEFVSKLIKSYFVLKPMNQKNIILPEAALSAGAGLVLVRHALRRYTLHDPKYRESQNIGIAKALILGFQL